MSNTREQFYESIKYKDSDMLTMYRLASTMSFAEIKRQIDTNPDGKTLTVQDVIYAARIVLNVDEKMICAIKRPKGFYYPRSIVRYICYHYTESSANKIGLDTGRVGTSNIFTGYKKVKEKLPFDWKLRDDIRSILNYLRSSGFKIEYYHRTIGLSAPNETSFKKGNSGNWAGRPKGVKNKPKIYSEP